MSDHDAPDPIDKAYTQAEAMLDDEAARAARRARVLGAVAGDVQAAPSVSAPPRRRVSWAAGGWLAAASVAGVSVLVALQFTRAPLMREPPARAETSIVADQAPAPTPVTTPAADKSPPAPPAAPQQWKSPPADVAVAPPLAFPASPGKAASETVTAPAPPPPAAPQAPNAGNVQALIITPPPTEARAESARAESPTAQAAAPASLAVQTARLHAAAAAGRLAELTSLLAQGTPVDAPDSEGETALMKAVQANRPAAADFLVRHGANLDRANRAGVSARDMAISINDPQLNRALGLEP